MGVPSYFSYIIKNHSNIIRNLNYHQNYKKTKFDSLYIDANSIIYDAYRTIEKDSTTVNTDTEKIEERIIEAVIDNIDKYISFVKPSNTIFIGFDGVAPFAKMEQQRTRRYKSEFMSKISFHENGEIPKSLWNTTSITPGTTFMNML
jgi:5'-3' exoribonuclease 1